MTRKGAVDDLHNRRDLCVPDHHYRQCRPAVHRLAVPGVAVMVGGGMTGGNLTGTLAALLSALGFAIFTVALRWGKLGNMLPAILLGGLFAMVPGAVTLAGGLILYTIGSRVVPAAQATLISLVEVLLAAVVMNACGGRQSRAKG